MIATARFVDVVRQVAASGWAFALWRDPNSPIHNLIACRQPHPGRAPLAGAKPGFIVMPFSGEGAVTLSADLFVRFSAQGMEILAGQLDLEPIARDAHTPESVPTDSFIHSVEQVTRLLAEGWVDKVVLSRIIEEPLPRCDAPELLARLSDAAPHAFVCLCYTPQHGLWMGASPELLVSWENERWFKTMALAGTRRLPESGKPQETAWTQKEIEEQAYVARDIVEKFKSIRLREFQEHGPRSVAAGPVVHLRTDYTVDTRAVDRMQLADEMLDRLHPTSAVCGTPREDALGLIQLHEPHDRSLYAGYWGPIGIDNVSRMYVNLRCLRWDADRLSLFVGAGITAASDPESEFNETELKADTLRAVIRGA